MFGDPAIELVIPFLALADTLLRLPGGVDLRLLPPRLPLFGLARDLGAVAVHLFDEVVEVGLYPAWDRPVFFKEVLPVVAVMPGAVLAVSDPEAPFLGTGPLNLYAAELSCSGNYEKAQKCGEVPKPG